MAQSFNPSDRSRQLEEMLNTWDRLLEENDRKIKEIKSCSTDQK